MLSKWSLTSVDPVAAFAFGDKICREFGFVSLRLHCFLRLSILGWSLFGFLGVLPSPCKTIYASTCVHQTVNPVIMHHRGQ